MSHNWQKTKRAARGVSVNVFAARAGPGNELVCCSVERKSSQKMEVRKQKYQMTFLFLLFFLRGQLQPACSQKRRKE